MDELEKARSWLEQRATAWLEEHASDHDGKSSLTKLLSEVKSIEANRGLMRMSAMQADLDAIREKNKALRAERDDARSRLVRGSISGAGEYFPEVDALSRRNRELHTRAQEAEASLAKLIQASGGPDPLHCPECGEFWDSVTVVHRHLKSVCAETGIGPELLELLK